MKVILKFLIKSIAEKKLRTFLIVLSITLSVALFFASNSFALTFADMIEGRFKAYFGNSDIVIWSNDSSPHWLFSMSKAERHNEKLDYVIGSLSARGTYFPSRDKSEKLNLRAFELTDLRAINALTIESESDLYPFIGNKIIMSTIFAQRYNLKVGDQIKIKLNDADHRLKIVALVQPKGFFQQTSESATMIIPLSKLSRLYQAYGRASQVFIKCKDGVNHYEVMEELNRDYKRYTVREPLNRAELEQQLMAITVPLQMMTILILCMSIFIIYTSFKVITMERLPIIGTFRSVGATKKTTDFILMLESIAYGVIGGIFGILLGFLILYGMAHIMSYNSWSNSRMEVVLDYRLAHIIGGFLLGLILSLVSSIMPIIKISQIPIKDIVLNKIETSVKKGSVRTVLGLIFLGITIIIPLVSKYLPRGPLILVINVISMVFFLASVIMLVPLFTKLFIALLERLFYLIFRNEGIIAVKNIKDNKSILNNISLISIGIAGILMINVISYSVGITVGDAYKASKFDIWMWIWKADRSTELVLRTVEGVDEVLGELEASDVEISGTKNRLGRMLGVDRRILDYWDLGIDPELFESFGEERNIILTYTTKAALDAEIGQVLTLKVAKKKERDYRVVGFFNSERNNGNYALIPSRFFKVDTGIRTFSSFNIKTRPGAVPADVAKRIEKKLERKRPWIKTMSQMEKNERESFGQVLFILKAFSVLTMLIGIFGVLNNLIISFIQRKRSLAMYRSIGMSRFQIVKMIFIESLSGGLIGGITGTAAGLFLAFIVANVTAALNLSLTIFYNPTQTIISALAGAFITVLASISPAIKTSKMKIIEAIKYE